MKAKGVTLKEAQALRSGNPSEEELRDFFQRRDWFFANNKRLSDYIEYSPMPVPRVWTEDPWAEDEMSKEEKREIRRKNRAQGN